MTIADFINYFLAITELPGEDLESIARETMEKAVYLVETTPEKIDDHYIEALRNCRNANDVMDLVESNHEYFVIFLSALMVLINEKLKRITLNEQQKSELKALLKAVEPIFDMSV